MYCSRISASVLSLISRRETCFPFHGFRLLREISSPSDHLITSMLDINRAPPITRVSKMAHMSLSFSSSTPSTAISTSNAITGRNRLMVPNKLSSQDQEHLERILKHKLHGIPTGHLPSLTLTDILQRTPRTHLPHIPPDISLAWLLFNQARFDKYIRAGIQNKADVEEKVVRAVWYYRLDPLHQFQYYHNAMRWNLAIYTALLTRHSHSQSFDNNTTISTTDKKSDKLSLAGCSPQLHHLVSFRRLRAAHLFHFVLGARCVYSALAKQQIRSLQHSQVLDEESAAACFEGGRLRMVCCGKGDGQ